MHRLFRGIVTGAFVALAGCTTVQPFDPVADKLSSSDLTLATQTFREVCLDTLPDFSQVNAVATAREFEPLSIPGQGRFAAQTYRTNLKSVIALTARFDESTPVCGVAFLGPDDDKRVQDAFVATTTRALGGQPRAKLRASQDDAAYHLRNQSTMIFEARAKSDGASHYVYLTPPVSREEAERIVAP
ncbi:hypothetical protein [uncultured Roseobacter sp.]|uniref:hypothetical protein n=1 Tax=uncultured Roseobacter sp. TaxID=114847 RepID=UPI002625712D|nr:hypothetical protein [uncultured Roseobacter sp.]